MLVLAVVDRFRTRAANSSAVAAAPSGGCIIVGTKSLPPTVSVTCATIEQPTVGKRAPTLPRRFNR